MATLSQIATRMTATAAATATALASGTTTAEVQALAKVIAVMALFPAEVIPLMERALSTPIDTNLIAY
jgi:hypothetical protein